MTTDTLSAEQTERIHLWLGHEVWEYVDKGDWFPLGDLDVMSCLRKLNNDGCTVSFRGNHTIAIWKNRQCWINRDIFCVIDAYLVNSAIQE